MKMEKVFKLLQKEYSQITFELKDLQKDKIEIQELIGCIIMFSAIILSQIPFKKNKKTSITK